jgi:hypothetical protein
MKLLFVTNLDRYCRGVSTVSKYAQIGKSLGHEVAIFGEQRSEPPLVDCTLDVKRFDFVIFVVYETKDFPDLPYLAQLLDGVPKERRVVIDACGRYNDTIRIEHDFNHLEKLDNHQGWEWLEGFQAVGCKILQPTLKPRRSEVRSFLFHGFDPASVVQPYTSAAEAALAWAGTNGHRKRYGVTYLGNNWQRWTQIRQFLEKVEPMQAQLAPMCLTGWGWDKRPEWAAELELQGVDVDPGMLQRLGVETRWPIPFDEVVNFLNEGRFSPIFHRPLFNELGLITVRTFETFCADTMPLLMVPDEVVEGIYGPQARPLAPGSDVAGRLQDMMRRPEHYWDAVLKTREYLAEHHSFQQRFAELLAILEN